MIHRDRWRAFWLWYTYAVAALTCLLVVANRVLYPPIQTIIYGVVVLGSLPIFIYLVYRNIIRALWWVLRGVWQLRRRPIRFAGMIIGMLLLIFVFCWVAPAFGRDTGQIGFVVIVITLALVEGAYLLRDKIAPASQPDRRQRHHPGQPR